jgi:hypothetical protein
MRTTLDLEPDVIGLAKSLAESRRISVGKAVSFLARRGAQAQTPLVERNGFSVFLLPESHTKFGPEDVRAALDAEDQAIARQFLNP